MTPRSAAVAEMLRAALDAADQLAPVERDALYTALVADPRTCRPEAVSAVVDALRTFTAAPLGMLPPPGEVAHDPGTAGGTR